MTYLRRIIALALIVASTAPALGQPFNNESLRNHPKTLQTFRDVIKTARQATVRVLNDEKDAAFGIVVESNGWILSKASVLPGSVTVRLNNGDVVEAKITDKNDEYDLVLLKIEAKDLKAIQWRDSKETKAGRWVASVGVADEPIAIGIVGVGTRLFQPGDQPPKTSPGPNSGYLGVGLETGMGGAKITQVRPKSPAERAGVKVNDIVYEAAGKKIVSHEDLIGTIQRFKAKDKVLLKIRRDDMDVEAEVTLDPAPKDLFGNPQERMGSELSIRRGGFPAILQHDTVIRPKDCGGPLVDLDGKALGINISRAGRTESYAIPSEHVTALLRDLKSGKLAKKVELGSVREDVILKKDGTLTNKDKFDKQRLMMAPKRYMRIEEVKLTANATYIIELNSIQFDTFIIVEDAAGKQLAADDDDGGELNARVEFRPPTDGTYRIVITSFQPSAIGNYSLSMRRQVVEK
ncbi:MAG: PDZ domain-containing protein [Gemmataceae bacterium]|nr:PDZ domain-containing protein [Gemmataceae bacterium]